ncbi:MAG TPA: hypothetical protein VJ717_09755, partial [Gemmatimonadaceae bacterium]|nr:hypothetical protein [Gemmatimonadaceae bacterium]
MSRLALTITSLSLAILTHVNVAVAQAPARRDTTIDAATRVQVIDSLIAKLDAGYVFPEKATEMGRDLRARLARGDYNTLTSAIGFADSLTAHLRAVSHDKHLRVNYFARPFPTSPQRPTPE